MSGDTVGRHNCGEGLHQQYRAEANGQDRPLPHDRDDRSQSSRVQGSGFSEKAGRVPGRGCGFSFLRDFKNGFQLSLWVWEPEGNKDALNGPLDFQSSVTARHQAPELWLLPAPSFCLFLPRGLISEAFPAV